jgi:hypothetical protein
MLIIIIAIGVFAGLLLFKARWVILIAIGVLVYLLPAHASDYRPLTTQKMEALESVWISNKAAQECKGLVLDKTEAGRLIARAGFTADEYENSSQVLFYGFRKLGEIKKLYESDPEAFCAASESMYGPKAGRLLKTDD